MHRTVAANSVPTQVNGLTWPHVWPSASAARIPSTGLSGFAPQCSRGLLGSSLRTCQGASRSRSQSKLQPYSVWISCPVRQQGAMKGISYFDGGSLAAPYPPRGRVTFFGTVAHPSAMFTVILDNCGGSERLSAAVVGTIVG